MPVERKKEKQKTPEELAAEQTKGESGAGKDSPKPATPKKDTPKKKAGREKAAPKPAAEKGKAEAKRGAGTAEAKDEPGERPEPEEAPEKAARPAAKQAEPAARKRPARGARAEASKPGRTRRAGAPAGRAETAGRAPERPVVRAHAKYVRSPARKARLVIEHIRGKSVSEARAVLRHTPRGVARDLEKLLESAIANAENNHDLVGDDLFIKDVYADEGPTLKRFRPRALGRATRINKRTTHLTLTLTPSD